MSIVAREFSFVDEETGELIEGRRADEAHDPAVAKDMKRALSLLQKTHDKATAQLLLDGVTRVFKVTGKGNLLYVD